MAIEIPEGSATHTNGHPAARDGKGIVRAQGRAAPAATTSGGNMSGRQNAISAISNHRVASTQDYLKQAGADIYGQYVFGEDVQQQYLAKPIFAKLRRTISGLE